VGSFGFKRRVAMLKRVAWMLGLGLCLLSCVVTLAFAVGSLLEPASSIYAMWSSFAWRLSARN
jgi:hypothetical protein